MWRACIPADKIDVQTGIQTITSAILLSLLRILDVKSLPALGFIEKLGK